MKKQLSWRVSLETARQIEQLLAYEGQENKSALLASAIEERWRRQHDHLHFDLAQVEAGICPWCGWDASPAA